VGKMRQTEVNPLFVVIGVVLVVGVFAFFFWIRPSMQESAAVKEWNSPEGLAKRGPERKVDPSYEAKVQELRAKEGRTGSTFGGRRRDRE